MTGARVSRKNLPLLRKKGGGTSERPKPGIYPARGRPYVTLFGAGGICSGLIAINSQLSLRCWLRRSIEEASAAAPSPAHQ